MGWYNDLVKLRPLIVRVFVITVTLLALIAIWAVYNGQDIKKLDFKNLIAEFWPKQQPTVSPSKDLRQQTKGNNAPIIKQHTEGDQSPAVNVAPGGTANITYGATKPANAKD